MELDESKKCEVLDALGRIACAMSGGLFTWPANVVSKDTLFCRSCDSDDLNHGSMPCQHPDFGELWGIFTYVLTKITRAPGPRITAMVALRRALVHAPSSNQMQLISSEFREFFLHSLRSSMRELRIVTGYTN